MLNRLFGNQPAIPEIDVQTFATERAAKEKIQIVDVRELDEWNAGHLSDAVLIPLGQLGARAGELDPSRPVVVVCRSGNRSGTATRLLLKSGFKDVRNLAGGMIAWVAAGEPVAR